MTLPLPSGHRFLGLSIWGGAGHQGTNSKKWGSATTGVPKKNSLILVPGSRHAMCNLCRTETWEHMPEKAEHPEVRWGFPVPQTLDHSACPLTVNDLRGHTQGPAFHWPAGSGPCHSTPWQETAQTVHILGYYASIWFTFLTNWVMIFVCFHQVPQTWGPQQ